MENNFNICGLLAMILGILSLLVLPLWFGLAAFILGIVGVNSAKKNNSGKGMAITGIVLGAISLGYSFVVMAILTMI